MTVKPRDRYQKNGSNRFKAFSWNTFIEWSPSLSLALCSKSDVKKKGGKRDRQNTQLTWKDFWRDTWLTGDALNKIEFPSLSLSS